MPGLVTQVLRKFVSDVSTITNVRAIVASWCDDYEFTVNKNPQFCRAVYQLRRCVDLRSMEQVLNLSEDCACGQTDKSIQLCRRGSNTPHLESRAQLEKRHAILDLRHHCSADQPWPHTASVRNCRSSALPLFSVARNQSVKGEPSWAKDQYQQGCQEESEWRSRIEFVGIGEYRTQGFAISNNKSHGHICR